jgi:hypothetical protein
MTRIKQSRKGARALVMTFAAALALLVISSSAPAQAADGERVELDGTFVVLHSHDDGPLPDPKADGERPRGDAPADRTKGLEAPTDDDPPREEAPAEEREGERQGARTPHGDAYSYWLESDGELFRLELDGREPPQFDPQQPIRVIGTVLRDEVLRTAAIRVEAMKALGPAPTLAPGPGLASVLIIRVYWNNTDSVSESVAENQVGTIDNNYYQENSYGKTGLSAKATEWFKIAQPPNNNCDDISHLWSEASSKATAAGWNLNAYDRHMVYVSSADCVGRGWGEIGGKRTWIQGTMNSYRTIHELGHNFGLGHAHTLACKDGSGAATAVSSSCTSDEYGDWWSVMGYVHAGESTANHIAAPMKDVLGWMSGRFQSVTSGTYTLARFESQPLALQALRIPTPTRTYWLEYRQPLGFDSTFSSQPGITGGALVHVTEPLIGSWLIDMTPLSGLGFADSALPVGQSWTDPERVFTLQVTAASSTALTVKVIPFPRRWAVLDGAGKLIRSAGVLSTKKLTTGRYEVVFNRNVSTCGYTATIGDTANALVYTPGLIHTASSGASGNGVVVETRDLGGNLADFPSHVNVNCSATSAAKFAVVGAAGNFVRGGGVVSTTRFGVGRYEVVFDEDVSGCAYTATVGDPATGSIAGRPWVFTAGGHTGGDGVYVETKNPGGGLSDFPFHLDVRCAGGNPAKSAVIDYTGNLVRGDGVLGVTRLGTGRFEVLFDRSVADCAYTATIGDPKNALVYNPGLVFTAGGHTGGDRVYVETKNPGGGLSNYPFHLAVSC